jgi:hypothetical protein
MSCRYLVEEETFLSLNSRYRSLFKLERCDHEQSFVEVVVMVDVRQWRVAYRRLSDEFSGQFPAKSIEVPVSEQFTYPSLVGRPSIPSTLPMFKSQEIACNMNPFSCL